ncbi:effector binding domain-containing protein [Alkalihalobacillus pseudalcaliphilus]|uniref:effector binding domain-containing protein n=1 Tax=Alkalihalobacillus pseudalcaliphilus TaxID=79884 RepID=UPI00064DC890|nr:effector binding domain-containing protein [Alkalihalobacillus pseudalcaliphilus]KMK77178.1 hypothetical protein AB990_06410 [Alkalihalobacillus pseudalcaliphilus]
MYFENRTFQIVARKYTEDFSNYSHVIPEKVLEVKKLTYLFDLDEPHYVIAYEAKRDEQHQVGSFYIGFIVNHFPKELPNHFITLDCPLRTYGVFETIFHLEDMGNYYDQLVRWIFSMNYTYTDDMIFELYESERKLTIYNPVKER